MQYFEIARIILRSQKKIKANNTLPLLSRDIPMYESKKRYVHSNRRKITIYTYLYTSSCET